MARPAYCRFVFDISDDALALSRSNCCARETWEGSDYCFWHAGGKGTKPQETLCSQPEVSEEANDVLLDQCRLPRTTIPSDVSVRGWSLRGSNLRECGLSGVDMADARLMHSCLEKADLRETTLHSADLSGADLRGVSPRSRPSGCQAVQDESGQCRYPER